MSIVRSVPTNAVDAPGNAVAHEPDTLLLAQIGARVREARAGRGMTRKLLATHSHISERYLAQLEAGLANPSLVLLSRLAEALGMRVTALLEARTPEAIEIGRITQILKQAPADALTALRARLAQEFGRDPGMRRDRIALIGLRGAGKSTLGTRLANSAYPSSNSTARSSARQGSACPRSFCSMVRPASGATSAAAWRQ